MFKNIKYLFQKRYVYTRTHWCDGEASDYYKQKMYTICIPFFIAKHFLVGFLYFAPEPGFAGFDFYCDLEEFKTLNGRSVISD